MARKIDWNTAVVMDSVVMELYRDRGFEEEEEEEEEENQPPPLGLEELEAACGEAGCSETAKDQRRTAPSALPMRRDLQSRDHARHLTAEEDLEEEEGLVAEGLDELDGFEEEEFEGEEEEESREEETRMKDGGMGASPGEERRVSTGGSVQT